jgi:hypothetical protein
MTRRISVLLPLLLLLGSTGCLSPTGEVGITLTASSSAANVAVGSSTTLEISLGRLGAYDATVRLVAENVPAGITASFSPILMPNQTKTSTMTIQAAPTAAIGTHQLTVRAIALGVEPRTLDVSVSVTAATAQ